MGKYICDQVFGAADSFFGEGWGVHILASKSVFGRGDGEVGIVYRRSDVEWDIFVKTGPNPEDPGRYKNTV